MPPHLQTTTHIPPIPSPLSHPVSPFSPLSPLFPNPSTLTPSLPHRRPLGPSQTTSQTSPPTPPSSTPTPDSPLPWLWTCHTCRTSYPLGATRRCLDDGHTFCAGVSSIRKRGRNGVRREKRRSRACGNEFDYSGWKAWSRWRRGRDGGPSIGGLERGMAGAGAGSGGQGEGYRYTGVEAGEGYSSGVKAAGEGKGGEAKKIKDCWESCTYPSHCRWGKAVGIHTPSPSTAGVSFNDFPPTADTHMADLPALGDCCDGEALTNDSGLGSEGELAIDPSLLDLSSDLASLPSAASRDLEAGREEEEDTAMEEVTSESGNGGRMYASGGDASVGGKESSSVSVWGMDGVRGGRDKEEKREKRPRSLRRCVAVTRLRVRTALF